MADQRERVAPGDPMRRLRHDLRGLAGTVQLNAELLMQGPALSTEDRALARDILLGVEQILALTELLPRGAVVGHSVPHATPVPLPARCGQRHGVVLVVDDEPTSLRQLERVLQAAGHQTVGCTTPADALDQMARGRFDALVTDVHLPGMDGVELAARVRAVDPDVPTLLVSAAPSVDSALRAFDAHVMAYLTKPLDLHALRDRAEAAVRACQLRRLRRRLDAGAPSLEGIEERDCFDALHQAWIAWQPIVRACDGVAVAGEALLRSDHPVLGSPALLIAAVEQHGLLQAFGRHVRAMTAASLADAPPGLRAFVNLHATDLFDPQLVAADAPLARYARRITFELTERRALPSLPSIAQTLITLQTAGYRLAVDDLGAGYSGLNTLAALHPEVVKLDMQLVRGIDVDLDRQRLVQALIDGCHDLGISVVGEGVETRAEADALCALGCDLLQGFYFARPARGWAAFS